jgi:hypothetical protein
MRLSSTPKANFSKAIVNQPSSLQQRQGLTITNGVEKRLGDLFSTTFSTFQNQLREQAPHLFDGQPHSRGFAHLQALAIDDFETIVQVLKSHEDSNHLTLAVDSAVDGVQHTLKVMSPSGEVVHKTWFNNETIGDVSNKLTVLFQELPRLAQQHPANG